MANRPKSFTVPFDLMDRLYRVLLFYANQTSYEAPRIGGVGMGCPRGKEPTSHELTWNAKWAIREIDRTLLPHNKPTDYWPVPKDELNELAEARAVLRKMMAEWDKKEGWISPTTWKRARKLLSEDNRA